MPPRRKKIRFCDLVSEAVWEFRRAAQLSQSQAAKRCGLSQVCVSRMENSSTGTDRGGQSYAWKLCAYSHDALGVPPSELFARAEYLGRIFAAEGHATLYRQPGKTERVMTPAEVRAFMEDLHGD